MILFFLLYADHRNLHVLTHSFPTRRPSDLVSELTIAEIVMLLRGAFAKSTAAHQGRWIKSAAGSRQVRGKTLGIVGYGNIGSQLAMLDEAMGKRVISFDRTDKMRHGNVEPASNQTGRPAWRKRVCK